MLFYSRGVRDPKVRTWLSRYPITPQPMADCERGKCTFGGLPWHAMGFPCQLRFINDGFMTRPLWGILVLIPPCRHMLDHFRKHIKLCLSRAEEATRAAENSTDLELKDRYSTLSSQWFLVARAYEFALHLEYGLLRSTPGDHLAGSA